MSSCRSSLAATAVTGATSIRRWLLTASLILPFLGGGVSAAERQLIDYQAAKSTAKARGLRLQLEKLRGFFDLSEVPPALRLKQGGAAAVDLIDILARLPPTEFDRVHEADAGPDFWTLPDTEITLVRVAEGPRRGTYLVSADTVERLPEFHARIIDLPPLRPTGFRNLRAEQINFTGPWLPAGVGRELPEPLHLLVLGTPLWKVLIALAGLALVALVNLLWAWAAGRLAERLSTVARLALRLTQPALLALSFWLFHLAVNLQVNLQGPFAEAEFVLHAIVIYLAAAMAVWLLCLLMVEAIIASPRIPDQGYDAHLLRLVGRLAALLSAAAILVYGANEIGIPALGLIAGLGVGGLAVALAARPTVENLFGGFSLFVDRPFRVGDHIIYGNSAGVVEAIGPRSTRIRGLDGTMMSVPNADLATLHITNFSNRNKCLFHHRIGLRYETSPAQFDWLLDELRHRISGHPLVERGGGFPRVRMIGFGASAIEVDLRAYVLTTDFGKFLEVQEQLILEIMKAVEGAGTGFAFPSQTTYLARDGGLDPDRLPQTRAPAAEAGASEPTERRGSAEDPRLDERQEPEAQAER